MSHNRLARLLSLGIFALLLALIYALDRVADSVDSASPVDLARVDFVAEKITAQRFAADGSQSLYLAAGSVRHVPKDDATQFANATLIVSRPGEAKTTVTANSARSVHRASEVFLDGEVLMQREADARLDAMTVRTSELRIDTQTQLAQTDAPVEVRIGKSRANATGLIANKETGTVELKSKVRISYVPKKHLRSTADLLH
jgi:lipopolysaccharide export system protein LptC